MYKLRQILKINKGNKKNFESNDLTEALAAYYAKEDIKKSKKKKNVK